MHRRRSLTSLSILIALAFAAVAPRPARAQSRPSDANRGLVAWYPFDGDALDRITGARAREAGTRPIEGQDGRPRGALWFDGGRSFVDTGDALQPQRFSIAAWIRPDAVDRPQAIVSKIQNLPGHWQKNFELRLDPGGRLFLHVPTGNGWDGVAGQRPIAPGRWTHVAAVYDGQRAQLFIDGVRDGAPYVGPYLQSRTPIFIGARPESGGRDGRTPSGPTYFFAGAIEDVRIWDRPVLDPELRELAAPRAPPGPPAPPPGRPGPLPPSAGAEPLAWYPLDGDAHDATGDADGAVVGALRPAEDRRGNPNGAVAFSGRDYVDLGVRVEPERFTVSAWVRPTRLDRDQVIFSKWSSSPGPKDRWLELRVDAGGRVSLAIPGGGYGRPQQVRSTRALAPGRWAFLAATFDGERAALYVDGEPDSEGTLQPFEASRGPTFLGARPDATGKRGRLGTFLTGGLDDVRVYRDALADRDVAQLFQERGPSRPPPGPGPTPYAGDEDREQGAFFVKVDRLLARFDAAVSRRNVGQLQQVEQRILEELEAADRAARAERNARIGGFIRRAISDFQPTRGRTDAMSLDRKRSALSGLADALWNDLAQELDDRPFGEDRGGDRDRRDDRPGSWY